MVNFLLIFEAEQEDLLTNSEKILVLLKLPFGLEFFRFQRFGINRVKTALAHLVQ